MINTEGMVEVDIESKAIIKGAPIEKATPVGVALGIPKDDGSVQRVYLAWGHPEGNNCTKEEAREVLVRYWDRPFVTHNGCGFDVPNLTSYFDLPERDPLLTHDTLFAAYLNNPHARSLKLKDLANDLLGIPPDEQQDMYRWILQNVPDCRSIKDCGAYISETPVSLSGPYATGDVYRTGELWNFLKPSVVDMEEAYQREQRLAPVLADMKRRGIRVDVGRLKEDTHKANIKKALLDQLIREHLKAPDLNPGSDKELGALLVERGYEGFLLTPKGKLSMARPSLEAALESDQKLKMLLRSRSIYDTLIGTFMEPWLRYALENDGRIHPSYNQVRNPEDFGTRTGRLSSMDPNAQNVPKDMDYIGKTWVGDYWGDSFPNMRSYLLPEVGQVWFCGDFKSQEPRLTAHYEAGVLLEAFLNNPHLDPYQFVMELVGQGVTRHQSKQIFLGLVYAMGADTLAAKLGCTSQFATQLRNLVKSYLVDVVALDLDCKKRFRMGLPIRTLGGRIYYCEPSSNGRTWEYKALNTLIQGSAADQNKEAMIYLQPRIVDIHGRILTTVHDEINSSIFEKDYDYVHEIYQEAANALTCECPMIMDTGIGENWATAKPD
jgi:DNA polymerase I-like protein with 3'-5' exonuclease and polymerase domains